VDKDWTIHNFLIMMATAINEFAVTFTSRLITKAVRPKLDVRCWDSFGINADNEDEVKIYQQITVSMDKFSGRHSYSYFVTPLRNSLLLM
jgi:hypothetical protein